MHGGCVPGAGGSSALWPQSQDLPPACRHSPAPRLQAGLPRQDPSRPLPASGRGTPTRSGKAQAGSQKCGAEQAGAASTGSAPSTAASSSLYHRVVARVPCSTRSLPELRDRISSCRVDWMRWRLAPTLCRQGGGESRRMQGRAVGTCSRRHCQQLHGKLTLHHCSAP